MLITICSAFIQSMVIVKSHVCCGSLHVMQIQMKCICDHRRSESQLKQLRSSRKKRCFFFGASTGFESVASAFVLLPAEL